MSVAERAGGLLETLVPAIHNTATLVQEIRAASSEQNIGVKRIYTSMQLLEQIIQQNAASSENFTRAAEELAEQAEQLRTTIDIGETPISKEEEDEGSMILDNNEISS